MKDISVWDEGNHEGNQRLVLVMRTTAVWDEGTQQLPLGMRGVGAQE
jgi:hypothetical protein